MTFTKDGYTVSISEKNTKLGKIGSFSTSPVEGCGNNCAACAGKCYARKSYRMYPNVHKAWGGNLKAVRDGQYTLLFNAVTSFCNSGRTPKKMFRWHVSGDIYNMDFLRFMVNVALRCNNTMFLCFTKQYAIINSYLAAGREIPDNLTIVLSQWDGLELYNPYNLPVSDVIFKHTDKDMTDFSHICPATVDKTISCDKCTCSCWYMVKGETVYFYEH